MSEFIDFKSDYNFNFELLFSESPISIWIDDFSSIENFLSKRKVKNQKQFRTFLKENPQNAGELFKRIRVLDVNQATLQLYNFDSKIELDKNISKIFREDSFVEILKMFESILFGKNYHICEIPAYDSAGHRLMIRMKTLVPDKANDLKKIIVYMHDLTELREAEARLKSINTELETKFEERTQNLKNEIKKRNETEEYFRVIAENCTEGVYRINSDGVMTYTNNVNAAMIGYKPEEIVGRKIQEFLPKDERKRIIELFSSAVNGEIVRAEVNIMHKEGYSVPLYYSAAPIYSEGEIIGCTGITQDLTKLRRESEIKNDFMSDVVHELRTPLAIMQAHSDLLKSVNTSKSEVTESLNAIDSEIINVSNLLSELSRMARAQGKFEREINKELVNSQNCLEYMVAKLRPLAEKNHIKITCDASDDINILVDRNLCQELFMNLIMNSITYGKVNGFIKIDTKKSKSIFVVTISDNGIGIPKDDLPKIFERFYRVEPSRSKDFAGKGIGLAVCKWIVDAHDWEIIVDSEVNKGTKIQIKIPV